MIEFDKSKYIVVRDNYPKTVYPSLRKDRQYCLVEYYVCPESYYFSSDSDGMPTDRELMQIADYVFGYTINISRGHVVDFFNVDISSATIGKMLRWIDEHEISGYNFYIDILKNRNGFTEATPAFLFQDEVDLIAFKLAWL